MNQVQIVLADDDVALMELLERRLGRAGYTVASCANGDDAFDLIASREPIILLADWEMPGLKGPELCQRIRAAYPESAVYIILLTASNDPARIIAGFEAGADDYLVKSAHSAELLARVRAGERVVRLVLQQQERAAELRNAQAETEQLLSSISSILIGVNADGRVTQWNRVAEVTFGMRAADVLGRPFHECGIQWDWALLAEHVARCNAEDRLVRPDELCFTRPDGTEGFLEITVSPIKWTTDKPAGYLIVAADTTEHRILQSQLAQAQKLESIGQLAAGIAHEINTPTQFVGDNTRFLQDAFADLQALLAKYAELLKPGHIGAVTPELVAAVDAATQTAELDYLREEIPQAIAQSLEGIERVSNIVRAMKEFSHPGGQEKQATDLNKTIESTITVARNEWKYVAEMVTDFDPDLPPVPCLVGDFNQVILNIIVNAAHAIAGVVEDGAAGKGTIGVSTRRDGKWAEVRIRDTGPGIPEEIRSRVFDPFFTTKDPGKGTGQGLAIAHSVVVGKHGGTIGLETEIGRGTTFVIRLPLEDESAREVGALADETAHSVC